MPAMPCNQWSTKIMLFLVSCQAKKQYGETLEYLSIQSLPIHVVCAVVFLASFGQTSSHSFLIQPQDKLNLEGSTVTFNCQATGLVSPSYYWLKDGFNTTRGTFSTATLTITSLTFEDAGLYSCCASSSITSITSNQAKLIVRGSPEITRLPFSISPHMGDTALLRYLVIGNPKVTISWYHNSAILSNGLRIKIFENGTLLISNVTKSDSGQYKLEAKNDLGVRSAFVDLTVLAIPSVPYFTTTPQNQTAKENKDVTFYCAASGSPKPTLEWIRLDGVIPNDRRSQPRLGALRLFGLLPSDDGVYACVANNTQGEKRAFVYLKIEGFPRFIISPTNKQVKENQSVILNCVATSIPTPTLEWLLPNGATITSHSMPSGNVRVLSNNSLVIDKISEDHGGTYKCLAQNSLGIRQEGSKLSVLIPPRFVTHLRNMTKTRGQKLTISCPARGNPAPEFQWVYGGNVIQRAQILHKAAVKGSDQGNYVCRVNNTMGVTSSTFYLRVITLPNITIAPSNTTVANGGTAYFHCQSQGDPNPSITWRKSGVLIQSNSHYSVLPNGSLFVNMTKVSDQGWFSCRAENTAGQEEKRAYLVVTGLPNFTILPSNKMVYVEMPVTLHCTAVAQDTPAITWYKVANDGTLHNVMSAVTLVSGDLKFDSVQRGDRSMYICRACNAAGCKTTPSILLNVLYGPSFPVPPSNVGVLQGQDASLKCEPDSSPKASITWRRPNGEKMEGTGYEQIIRNVQPVNTGEYTCKASNPYGDTDKVKIKLMIQTKPVIVNLLKQGNSKKTTVTCKVDGKPTPIIGWYLGNERLPQNAKYPDYSVTRDDKLSIPIGSLENKTFLCNASNPQGFDVYFAKVPECPSSVSLTKVTSHSLRVTWIQSSRPEFLITHYLLEMWQAKTSSWQLVNSTVKETFYHVFKLFPFTTYVFRVKAANGLGSSQEWETSHNVTTLSYRPSVPQNLSLSVQSAELIKVTWLVPQILNGPLSDLNYHVTYEPKSPNVTNEHDVGNDGTVKRQEYNLVDLKPDVRYSIRVSAWRRRSDGTKLESNEVTASEMTLQIVPKTPPIGIVVEASGPTQIIIKWKKPSYSVSGYNIWYRQNKPGLTNTKVHITDGSATMYLIMNLNENTGYLVKVQMFSNAGEGPFSNYYEVYTSVDTFYALKNPEIKGTSWKVAVGGLVCGFVLLFIVIGIVWCLRRRSQQSNQTFRVSKRRRTQSDAVASSAESDGTVEGQYNIAFNQELDHNLDLDMFSDDGNVVPISTSYRNERAIEYLGSSKPDVMHEIIRSEEAEGVYANLPRNDSSDARSGPDSEGNTVNSTNYEPVNNKKNNDKDSFIKKSTDSEKESSDKTKRDNPIVEIPVYSQVNMSNKRNRKSSREREFDQYLIRETDGDIGFDADDPSEVPYPDEDQPPIERTWTNVSEFNFPPPPNCPPPNEDEVLNADGPSERPTKEGLFSYGDPYEDSYGDHYEDPYENVEPTKAGSKELEIPKDKGPPKQRMVADWAEGEEEPIGNLWEAVDKELDRRLGTT